MTSRRTLRSISRTSPSRFPARPSSSGASLDAHRGVVRHSGDRELELTDLIGDGAERLEVDLAPCGGGGIGGYRHRISDWFE